MDAEIIGIFGLQGWGKTALMVALGKQAYDNGYKIFSNVHLNYEYTPITTLTEAQKCRNGFLLLDELWQWVHARTSQSKINKEMMAICLLNRKRNINIIYNTQLPRTIDVILRDVTTLKVLPHMKRHKDGKRYVHYVARDLLGREVREKCINIPIDELGNMFNTREEIGKLEKELSPLEKGIGLEKDFAKALKKIKGVNFVDVIPNSGNGSSWRYDVIAYTDKGLCAFDVKSATTHVFINEFGNDILNKIDNAKDHNATPYIAFPDNNYKRTGIPSAWRIYELTKDSYLKRLNAPPRYNKLFNKSKKLSKLHFCI